MGTSTQLPVPPPTYRSLYYCGKGNLAVCRFETYWHAIRSDNELEEGEELAGGGGDIPAPYLILFYWSIITRHGSQWKFRKKFPRVH